MVQFTEAVGFDFGGKTFVMEDIMEYLEETCGLGDCNGVEGKVYSDIKWTGKYEKTEMNKVKNNMVREYFGV